MVLNALTKGMQVMTFVSKISSLSRSVWSMFVLAAAVGPCAGQSCQWDGAVGAVGVYSDYDNPVRSLVMFDAGDGATLYAAPSFFTGLMGPCSASRWDGRAWVHVGPEFDQRVSCLAVFDDGTGAALYAGGWFHHVGDVKADGIARWDGREWCPLTVNPPDPIFEVELMTVMRSREGQGGHQLVLDVQTTSAGKAILAWDGARWKQLASHTGDARTMTVLSEARGDALYVGGQFTRFAGLDQSTLARWDGVQWHDVSPPQGNEITASAAYARIESEPEALIVSATVFVPGVPQYDQLLQTWDGRAWTAWSDVKGEVLTLETVRDGSHASLVAGGTITEVDDVAVSGVARWDGQRWTSLGPGVKGPVRAVQAYHTDEGTALCVAGGVAKAGDEFVVRVASWDRQGWSAMGNGVGSASNPSLILALASFDDGSGSGPSLHAGGYFQYAGDQTVWNIAKWDGKQWSPVGGGLDGGVLALHVHDEGGQPTLYVGGTFTRVLGVNDLTCAEGLVRWNGSQWSTIPYWQGCLASWDEHAVSAITSFDNGAGLGVIVAGHDDFSGFIMPLSERDAALAMQSSGRVNALAVMHDRSKSSEALFAAGTINADDDYLTKEVIRWNGRSWEQVGEGFADSPFPTPEFFALAVYDDGSSDGPSLFAGGRFSSAGSVATNNIARWDGRRWWSVGEGTKGPVYSLVVHDDGDGAALYAGGRFDVAGGSPASNVAKWDGRTWTALESGVGSETVEYPQVFALHSDRGGPTPGLTVGGSFTAAGSQPVNHLATWTCRSDRDGDLDGSGIVDGADLAMLLAAWGSCPESNPCQGDLDSDGIVNGLDLALLLGQWG